MCFYGKVCEIPWIIDSAGLHTSDDKVKDLVNASAPRNVSELRSYLGLVNYYAKFLENLSTVLHPMNCLLQSNTLWCWTKKCEESFVKSKEMVINATVLAHYDVNLPLCLACDASPYGVGAVLSHIFPDETKRPIAFVSRSLTKSEKAYAQIDKEALSIVFGVKRFHQFLYGREFNLVTDHRPLTALFGQNKPIPTLAASRMQRWALILSAYNYKIEYRTSKANANADCMSRLPVNSNISSSDTLDCVDMFQTSVIDTSLPVTCANIRTETRKDPILSCVYNEIMNGWTNTCSDLKLKPYFVRRNELTIHQGCIMWGIRVVVPQKLQPTVLNELHTGHFGIVRMKSLARSFVWWPNIDCDIEQTAKSCYPCQQIKHMPPSAPVHPWSWPSGPWHRIHLDFAGPFLGHMFLLCVDAYSKYPEFVCMDS